jgi:hypothetical protein
MMHRRNAGSSLIAKPRNDRCPAGDGTLLCVDLQFEAPCDGAGQARHDPPAGFLAANVDVAVIAYRTNRWPRRSRPRSSSSKTRFGSRGESGPPPAFAGAGLAGSLPGSPRTAPPAIEHTGGQVSPDQPTNPPIRDPRRHRGHQPIVVDPVGEFCQVAACSASIRRNNVVAPLLEEVEANSESNRDIPNLPGVLGDGAIGGEPAHTGDVQ